jgi:hypothetical protein
MLQNIKVTKKEGQEYDLLAEDMYQVELLDVNSEERPTYDTRLNPKENQLFETVLNFDFVLLEGEARGRHVWMNFVPTYLYISKKNGKNKLYQIVESLLTRELTQEEFMVIDSDASQFLNGLIGKQCRVMVKHKQSGDKTFANIAQLLPAKTQLEALTVEEKTKGKKPAEPGDPDYIDPANIPF